MRRAPSTDVSSIYDALIARVIQASPPDVAVLVEGVPESTRAQLAIFCNARAHLREHGRAIAATCSRFSLASAGGLAGAHLFDSVGKVEAEPPKDNRPYMRPVTVARGMRSDLQAGG